MKKILFLAPQPFFQERGTPIAVRMAVETLGKQKEFEVTLLTYHEGFDITLKGVSHERMWAPKWLYGIRPGISIKKLIADFFFFLTALKFLLFGKFNVIHAVEESVYMALPFAWVRKIPLVYDMDSSIAEQLTDSWYLLRPLKWVISFAEKLAIKKSVGILAVCEALKTTASTAGAKRISLLYDVSLLANQNESTKESLRDTAHISKDTPVVLYIGNLEGYQGIDLLLKSFEILIRKFENIQSASLPHLIILGGSERHIEKYANLSKKLGIDKSVSLLGPRPLSMLGSYLSQATLLASPRTKGNNTPMKIYSYLDSGIPMVATDLPTHTQVVTHSEAFLAAPTEADYAEALFQALQDPIEAAKRGTSARRIIESKYNRINFDKTLLGFYSEI